MNNKPIHSQRVEELSNECLHRFPKVPWLSSDEFLRRSEQEDWSIVDVRSQREQAVLSSLSMDSLRVTCTSTESGGIHCHQVMRLSVNPGFPFSAKRF